MDQTFKRCGACRFEWDSWDTFIVDPGIRFLGMQAVPEVPEASALVFEHRCGSSVSVLTRRLEHLVPALPFEDLPSLRGTSACAMHCFSLSDRGHCDRNCSHRRDREILAIVERIMK